jgi:hypothetical protein
VTIEWDGYEIHHPGTMGPQNTLPRAEARRAFERVMNEKSARIAMLGRLLEANGLELTGTDAGIQGLNDWFRANVESDPAEPGRLSPDWYSVAHDVALFLGDVMIARGPGLRWDFFTGGKKDVAYQKHVIVGFTRVPNPKYNIDVDRRVATYGHRIVASHGSVPHYGSRTVRGVEIDVDAAAARQRALEVEDDAFLEWVRTAESKT